MIANQDTTDPHVACRHRLLTAYAWFVASRPIEGSSNPTTSAHKAAQAVNTAKRREVARILALPAPVTLDGLRVFGLALTLSLEGTSVEGDTDVAAARAILSATQENLPPGSPASATSRITTTATGLPGPAPDRSLHGPGTARLRPRMPTS